MKSYFFRKFQVIFTVIPNIDFSRTTFLGLSLGLKRCARKNCIRIINNILGILKFGWEKIVNYARDFPNFGNFLAIFGRFFRFWRSQTQNP